MKTIETVTLERGTAERRETLAHLTQLYIHDFTDFLGPTRRIDIGEDGRFRDLIQLDSYWTAPDREVWFVRANAALAGFALINRHSHSGRPVDFNMGEFFVIRPFRGRDVAEQAVIGLLNDHPGQWEVAIGAYNTPAQRFWPRALARANITNFETLEGDGVEWTGPILRLIARRAA